MIGTNKDEATLFLFADPRFGDYTEADLAKRAKQAHGDKADALVAALRETFPDYSPSHLTAQVQTVGMFWGDSITLAERKPRPKALKQGAARRPTCICWNGRRRAAVAGCARRTPWKSR